MAKPPVNVPGKNRILELAGADGAALASGMRRVEAERGHFLARRGDALTHVHFPLRGMVSMVLGSEAGLSVEVGTVGNEGMVGSAVYLRADRASADVFFETSGEYLQIEADAFMQAVKRSSALDRLVARYTQAMIAQMAQSVLCSALHGVEERLAKWLLMTHDRLESDELDLTQEFLAQMLGARRPTVTVVAGVLQQAGLIRYNRGRVTVLDRNGLEDASCECYFAARAELDRLLEAAPPGR